MIPNSLLRAVRGGGLSLKNNFPLCCKLGVPSPKLVESNYSNLATMNVFVTRSVPSSGLKLLKEAGLSVTQWQSDDAIPRSELLERVKGKDGLFCLLTETIDAEVLDIAGELML